MSNKSGTDIISTPQGGGALKGIGEKFSPDLHTGTGNYTIPIELPPGRNGLQPKLSLVYSTGNGNSPFGLGWSLSIPGVSRKTDKGVPVYDDDEDVFILSGSEDLVRVTPHGETTGYRPRTEGTFARIEHIKDASKQIDYWQVRSKDGMVSTYGSPEPTGNPDDAVIADPKNKRRIHAWKLTETRDPFGNRVVFSYVRDKKREDKDGQHCWDQVYLSSIQYVDYGDNPNDPSFLVRVEFDYEERPDPFSDYRAGFEIRTVQRCRKIEIYIDSDRKRLTRTYHLEYVDENETDPARLPHNKVSLLAQIRVEGHRTDNGRESPPQCLPPLTFKYGPFEPDNRQFDTIEGSLPAVSLSHPHYELVDLFGNGLPDIIEMNGNGRTRYWRNLGNKEFDYPRSMSTAPPCNLADSGVQLIDADGDGRTDLLVSTANNAGFYPLTFHGEWDRRSYQRYAYAPSFNLEDPEVKLVDLTGDGVTDVIRSGSSLECFFNDPQKGWDTENTRRVPRRQLEDFPNINFSDPRVKWADMTGDGLTDVVLVHDGRIDYWPSLGYGDFGPRVTMKSTPRFPYGYDPRRILIGDVDGDGAADLIYVDNGKVTLWMNQSGNEWSEPIVIQGTPQVTDMDAVRLVDLFGTGVSGLLWSRDATVTSPNRMYFLVFVGGHKPYLLEQINNNMGSVTNIGYSTSTQYYLEDQAQPETAWTSPLPFPVQVVAQVESIDEISGGKLTTEYTYHHGYWDGAEREFRGFGRVDQRDTEVFQQYHSTGLDDDEKAYNAVPAKQFSPPTELRTWFHQGPVGPEYGDWKETDFSHEFWQDDPQAFRRSSETVELLRRLNSENRRDARDAVRALRSRVLRTELYALDGTRRQTRPYTVTENLHGLKEIDKPSDGASRDRIFFPFEEAQRTTQWERGDDPLTRLSFIGNYDEYGQPQLQLSVAVPRGRDYRNRLAVAAGEYYLATRTLTRYAQPADPNVYIFDRVAHTTVHQVKDDRQESAIEFWQAVLDGKDDLEPAAQLMPDIVSHTLNKYDGAPFIGRDVGEVGAHGALMSTEQLVLTPDILSAAYPDGSPPYLVEGAPVWTSDYPQAFRDRVDTGYEYHPTDTNHINGFYTKSAQNQYDARGMLVAQRDFFDNQTDIAYDTYALFPVETQGPEIGGAGGIRLTTSAIYDYQATKPESITDPNGNQTTFKYTPLGLLKSIAVLGKPDDADEGDKGRPGTVFEYDFESFQNSGQPIYTHTRRYTHHDTDPDDTGEQIETREYTDGFGRLLQTRALAEDILFGTDDFGNDVLPIDQTQNCPAVGKKCLLNEPNIIVSGWQTYDNKGRVVEKYEPFFSSGWEYAAPTNDQCGQKATLYYDPRGRVVRTVDPNDSEQLTLFGIPRNITDPSSFDPTPWESYIYDANDNADRTKPLEYTVEHRRRCIGENDQTSRAERSRSRY
jgi:YD repeat-containing protein